MKVLLICAENYSVGVGPFARAVGSMVLAYRKQGAEVLGFSPFFSKFEKENEYSEVGKSVEKLRNLEYSVLKRNSKEPFEDLFIGFDDYFGRNGIYGDENEKSYMDNHLRFSFLASAAINYCIDMKFKPDAIHVHDWSGIAGVLTKNLYSEHFRNIPVVLTVHSICYDFHCTPLHIHKMGLPSEDFNADGYEFWDKVSMLKVAILYSDKIVFTSDSYLPYLLETDLPGGMRGFLESQSRKLLSIQSGVDYDVLDIPKECEEFKKKRKEEFKAELGLEANSGILLYTQLNVDFNSSAQVISTILANLLNMNLQLAIGVSEDNPNYSYFTTIQEKNRSKMVLLPFAEDDKSLLYRFFSVDLFFSLSAENPSLENFFKAAAAGCVPLSSKRTKIYSSFLRPLSELKEEERDKANSFIAQAASPDLILEQICFAESVYNNDKSLWSKIVKNALNIRVPLDEMAKKYFSIFTPN
ncbi:MAG: glycogen/starch synthase [Fibromonadaceae bacterium]|jgi:starch synthase|nr:glycogen/starch synthase [Fibromonadaceae bacterium]